MPRSSRVKLLKQVKINDKWVLATALFDSKGRVRKDHVRVSGNDENHPEGSYFIEWWDQGQRHREAAGALAQDAAERARIKQAELAAVHNGIIPAAPAVEPNPQRTSLSAALDGYIEYVRYHRSLRTFRTYRPILDSFKAFCEKTYVDEVERQDLLDFATDCLKQGQKGKSIYNKLVVISQVMKQHDKAKLLNASDWPSFVETVRPIYEDFELAKLFRACTSPEEVRFKFYLMSGFRDAEGRFVTWRDVDFKHMAVRVTAKPHWGFQPKNWEEREVPVPQKLVTMLQKFRPANATPDDPLFPSATGRPDGAMLEKLKAVAYRGKLNCGHCAVSHKLEERNRKDQSLCRRSLLWPLVPAQIPPHVRHAAPPGRHRHPDPAAMDGTPRHRFDDGLSQGRPQQRRPGPDRQGQPSSIRLVVFGLRLEAR